MFGWTGRDKQVERTVAKPMRNVILGYAVRDKTETPSHQITVAGTIQSAKLVIRVRRDDVLAVEDQQFAL